MRSWERALLVLEALWERGQVVGHGWTLDMELLPSHQQQVNALENQGLVELACREDRAELSALEGRPVRWTARLTPYGHDMLTYGQSCPRVEPPPGEAAPERQLVELIPSQMAALRVFVGLADQLRVPPADGLAEQVRAASCDHGIKRWRLYLTQEQMDSVAYGLWLHRMTGSAAEANRFVREYGVEHSPARGLGEGPVRHGRCEQVRHPRDRAPMGPGTWPRRPARAPFSLLSAATKPCVSSGKTAPSRSAHTCSTRESGFPWASSQPASPCSPSCPTGRSTSSWPHTI